MPGVLQVDITDATGELAASQTQWLAAQVLAAGNVLLCIGQVRVRVVNDPEMATAHEEFAGVSGTTDVLTFDLREGAVYDPQRVLGPDFLLPDQRSTPTLVDTDIMVCLDEARRQAARRGYAFERELLLYVVHGVLHCLGLDDHDEEQFAAMHRLEDAVLEAIGVGAVFGVEPQGGAGQG